MKKPRQAKLQAKNASVAYWALLLLAVLAMLIGTASATAFTMCYAQNNSIAKTPDVRLVAGPDSTTDPITYPAATVTVASTFDYATVGFSLFPSDTNTPQPSTYYTNLLQITNVGTGSHTIQSVTVSGITGASNLGSLTIYYYATQTDTPQTGTPIGSVILTSSSNGTYTLVGTPQTLVGSSTNYIEIVGNAAPSAAVDSTVSFILNIQWT